MIFWSQQNSDKITIMIDDRQEFLPNVNNKQKIKIIPYNRCKEGDETPAISKNLFPNGYYRNQNKK